LNFKPGAIALVHAATLQGFLPLSHSALCTVQACDFLCFSGVQPQLTQANATAKSRSDSANTANSGDCDCCSLLL
jgi:hypothetical protein